MSQRNQVKNQQPIIFFFLHKCFLFAFKSWRAAVGSCGCSMFTTFLRDVGDQQSSGARGPKFREDEAEEGGDDKGVVTLLTSLSVQTHSGELGTSADWGLFAPRLTETRAAFERRFKRFIKQLPVLRWSVLLNACSLLFNHWKYKFLLTRQHLRHDSVRAVWPLGCRVIYSPAS